MPYMASRCDGTLQIAAEWTTAAFDVCRQGVDCSIPDIRSNILLMWFSHVAPFRQSNRTDSMH